MPVGGGRGGVLDNGTAFGAGLSGACTELGLPALACAAGGQDKGNTGGGMQNFAGAACAEEVAAPGALAWSPEEDCALRAAAISRAMASINCGGSGSSVCSGCLDIS